MRANRIGWILPLCLITLAPTICAGQAKAPAKSPSKPAAGGTDPALLHPAQLTAKAPDKYTVKLTTTKGAIMIEVTRSWSPLGADRFYNLVKHHYYDNASFYRVVTGFVVQFGISADPKVNDAWHGEGAKIKDDPVTQTNARGTLTFATSGANSRTTQVFINLRDNKQLDGMDFSPFGKVTEGMEVVTQLYSGYGDMAEIGGPGPSAGKLEAEGKAYADKNFPKLDSIVTMIVEAPAGTAPAKTPAKAPSKAPAKSPGQ